MTPIRKMSKDQRQAAILQAARKVFVEKGFHGTTSRQLAEAAGVSEALLFKHFPSKEALYRAILTSCCRRKDAQEAEHVPPFESLPASTETLVELVWGFVSHILGSEPEEEDRLFFRLILRSLMEEGEFTRLALEGMPFRWMQKVAECVEAAHQAGDLPERTVPARLAGWLVHHLVSGFLMHSLPGEPLVNYPLSRQELVQQVVWFCLRGIGLPDSTIQRCLQGLQQAERGKPPELAEPPSGLPSEENLASVSELEIPGGPSRSGEGLPETRRPVSEPTNGNIFP